MQLTDALRLALRTGSPDVVAVVGGGGKSSAVFRMAKDAAAQGARAIVTHTARIAAFQTEWAPIFVEAAGDTLSMAALAQALDAHGWCLLTGPTVGDRRAGLEPAGLDQLAGRAAELGLSLITVEADGSKMRPVKAPAEHEPVLPACTTLLAPTMGLDAVGGLIDERWVHRPERVRKLLGISAEAHVRLAPAQAATLLVDPSGGAKAIPPGVRLLPLLNKADGVLRLTYGRMVAQRLAQRGQPSLLTTVGSGHADPVVERWGPVAVVVLAAGASLRMGRPKQLEPIGGTPMVVRAVRTALHAGLGPVLLVVGAHRPQVEAALAPLQAQAGNRLIAVANPHWESGQASSMHAALESLPTGVEAAIFMPVDQPYLEPQLLRQLAGAWRRGAPLAAPLVDGVVRGAPALFDLGMFGQLRAVVGDVGGRAVLRQHGNAVAVIPAPADWLRDIDRPEDLSTG